MFYIAVWVAVWTNGVYRKCILNNLYFSSNQNLFANLTEMHLVDILSYHNDFARLTKFVHFTDTRVYKICLNFADTLCLSLKRFRLPYKVTIA